MYLKCKNDKISFYDLIEMHVSNCEQLTSKHAGDRLHLSK